MGVAVGVAAILFAANWVGAIAAYGGSILALPLLTWLLADSSTAVATILPLGAFQSYHLAWVNRHHTDRGALARMLAWCAVGVPFGFLAADRLPERGLLLVMGIVVAASGLLPFVREETPGPETHRPRQNLLLTLGGLIHGAFAAGGGPVVVAARRMLPEKDGFRGTLFAFWSALNTAMIVLFLATGRFTPDSGKWIVVGLPFVVLGGFLGERNAKAMDQRTFAKVVAGMLLAAGLTTIVRNLF